jgi:pyruvate dehydrogenase E1 component alpha subunit
MPRKVINKFEVEYLQVLSETGNCDEVLMPHLTNSALKSFYEGMVLTRMYDDKALKLQRQGRMGTYAPVKGQEAIHIGSAFALQDSDWIVPSFRCDGVYLMKEMGADKLYQYWAGDEWGMCIPKKINILPISITVGAHPLHAVGIGMALKYQKKKAGVITYFGDGATSEGDFHEAMNFAGALKLPVVFVCQNNQWAISVPVKEQTASETIAQKAIAYGFKGLRIDGNDVFGVYLATMEAMNHARSGKGPVLIEALTYRMGDHTTSDDAKKYRKEKEVIEWEKKDPILRLKKYMTNMGMFEEKYEASVKKQSEEAIDKAVEEFEKQPKQKPETIFDYMFETLTPELKEQREKIIEENLLEKASAKENNKEGEGVK